MSANALAYDGKQFYGQVYGRLKNSFADLVNKPFMKKLYEECEKPRLSSFIPSTPSLLYSPSDLWEGRKPFFDLVGGEVYFDEINRLKSGNQHVVSLSTADEEVIVWDVQQVKPVRTLKGLSNPNNLKIIDDTRVVILCGRELKIYNLDDGSFISTLKGLG
jgi:hypothetical protein